MFFPTSTIADVSSQGHSRRSGDKESKKQKQKEVATRKSPRQKSAALPFEGGEDDDGDSDYMCVLNPTVPYPPADLY